jgi:hypothetical protein
VPDGFPVTITDDDGGAVEIDLGVNPGEVYIRTSPGGVHLDAERREQLAQALVAACWRAGHRAGYGQGRDDEAEGLPVSDMRTVAPDA